MLKFGILFSKSYLAQYMSGSKNNTMVTSTKHNSKHTSSRSSTPGLFGSERFAFWNFLPTLSYTSVAYMLIVVAILLFLVIVYKHVAKPSWIPSSQQLSEKFKLYMAGSMIGDFIRWIFNDIWTKSRQDTVVSNKDEKNRRLSLDMSSSSSTSLSPSVLPTHNTSPRSYKNTRFTSHRRPGSRQKTQSQNIPASSLSPIEDNPSSTSSHIEQSSTFTEQDETKTSVTIHVADTLNSRTDSSSVDVCQESKGEIDKIVNHQKLETSQDFVHENINSWTESQQTPTVISNKYGKSRRTTAELTFLEATNNGSSKLQKKNSMKGHRKQNARNKEQTVVLATQESDGEIDSIISDDHSDSLIQQNDVTVPTIQKHVQDSIQEETFVKHKGRRRRTRGSKNNQQKVQQSQQIDQRSLKQEQPVSSQKQVISYQNASDIPKSRHHHSNDISKSRQSAEKLKTDTGERQHVESHQSSHSDQTVYLLQANKRTGQIYHHSANLDGTAIPAKATLPESNRKAAVFPRTDNIHWKPNVITTSSHVSAMSHNFNSTTTSNVTYADVIAPQKSTLPRPNTSGLSNGNNITTPVPAASMNNKTNHQWYSPFGSGLSIQLTPPASPQNIHRHLPSSNSNASSSIYFKQSQDRNRNVIAPPPSLPASNNVSSFSSSPSSSLSMFTSSSFPSLSNSSSNQNQSNVTSPTNSSFRESLFGRKYPVQDQEKGELSDEADDSENWNKKMRPPQLTNHRTQTDALLVRKGKFDEGAKTENISWHREQQEPQQQFSLFDKRLSFMYPPRS
ncbi:hypothetical protein C1645_753432 [Glomus cerebriforme]|uniref:Uncharacterized protein n=1 Tax=Glomus cerebriforme TaxID=658196 RepID=A0A397TQB0_9GLOM|nr:hypothetical protein C1645_753432 [Glomus cerebriforme]